MEVINCHTIETVQPGNNVALRCPACGGHGTFEPVNINDLKVNNVTIGIRRCPLERCNALIYYWMEFGNPRSLRTYPAERIDFDPTDIPAQIQSALEESITCHSAECFVAAAMMIRKTLELVCWDKEATGENLKQRIESLGRKIIIPPELLVGMQKLRLLGNDAAHIKSRAFDEVDKEEIEVGIEFATEILRAVYQYGSLLKRLTALQTPSVD